MVTVKTYVLITFRQQEKSNFDSSYRASDNVQIHSFPQAVFMQIVG